MTPDTEVLREALERLVTGWEVKASAAPPLYAFEMEKCAAELRAALATEIVEASKAAPQQPVGIDGLRTFFAEHGWSIHMDNREGQPLDPFAFLAAQLNKEDSR